MLRTALLAMSKSERMQRWTMHSRLTKSVVERFVAGNTLEEGARTAKRLNEEGLLLTMDYLGEAVADPQEADRAVAEYLALVDRIRDDSLLSTVSIKPTHFGMGLDVESCARRVEKVVRRSVENGLSVEIDMEDTPFTDATLNLYRQMLPIDPKLRVCLQSYLFRSPADLKEIIGLGGSVRLVKGAYKEPPNVAFRRKKDVDKAFEELIKLGLSREALAKGFYLAVATHDENLVKIACHVATERGVRPDQFEFQFLYGIRTDLQKRLVSQGFRVRVYLPYGMEWYPYFMRRLAERPANLIFLLKNLVRG